MFAGEGTDEAGLLDQTVFTQSALFAFEVALFRLVESCGLRPAFLAGHSVGELAAAHVAGVLDVKDACTLVAARGRLMQALPQGGAMLSVQAPLSEVEKALADHAGRVEIAAVNGPTAIVVSGERDALARLEEGWREQGVTTRMLRVSHAFHSPLMDPMLDDFRTLAQQLTFHEPRITVVSTVTGLPAAAGQLDCAEYWVEQVRRPVRFQQAVEHLAGQGQAGAFVEIGPRGVLTAMADQCLPDTPTRPALIPLARSDRPEDRAVLTGLARAWTTGTDLTWPALLPTDTGDAQPADGTPVELPTYAFDHTRYWLDR
ncbi:hypothetical protein AV521_46175, partial [Streptomyces sp. IMTB 2501]